MKTSIMPPPIIKAVVVSEPGKAAKIQDVSLPKIKDGWVLVKVLAVGVNPTDWKHVDYNLADMGSRLGCDYVGIVEEIGRSVTRFQKGDQIGGFVHGG